MIFFAFTTSQKVQHCIVRQVQGSNQTKPNIMATTQVSHAFFMRLRHVCCGVVLFCFFFYWLHQKQLRPLQLLASAARALLHQSTTQLGFALCCHAQPCIFPHTTRLRLLQVLKYRATRMPFFRLVLPKNDLVSAVKCIKAHTVHTKSIVSR